MAGAEDGHAPCKGPARTLYWIGRGRCPDCGRGETRPELVDGTCPECGWEK